MPVLLFLDLSPRKFYNRAIPRTERRNPHETNHFPGPGSGADLRHGARGSGHLRPRRKQPPGRPLVRQRPALGHPHLLQPCLRKRRIRPGRVPGRRAGGGVLRQKLPIPHRQDHRAGAAPLRRRVHVHRLQLSGGGPDQLRGRRRQGGLPDHPLHQGLEKGGPRQHLWCQHHRPL